MRTRFTGLLLGIVLTVVAAAFAGKPASACVPLSEVNQHIGAAQCVSGTVLNVSEGQDGMTFLDFCAHASDCPFTVVVFPGDLKKMGDIRQLEGRQIEIKGTIQDYDGRPRMILRRAGQLGNAAFLLVPPVPSEYDVERRGHYSAGKYSHPKAAKNTKKKQTAPVSIEDPEEPQ